MSERSVLTQAFRTGLRLLVLPVAVALLAIAVASPVAAQGTGTTVYLPVIPRNQPGLIGDPQWVSPFGIVMYGGLDEATLTRMRSAGSSWVVTMLSWQRVESSQGSLNWSTYDAEFLAAKNAGMMDVAVLVTGVPEWARGTSYPYPGGGPGMNVGALASFLGQAAERYDGDGVADAPGRPVVKYWTLFAEPDYCGYVSNGVCVPRLGEEYKGVWGISGQAYAQMLQVARAAIKAAAPRALVMNGGVAFDYFTHITYENPTRKGIYVRQFMADVIAAGGGQHMDMLAVHYYPVSMADWAEKLTQLFGTVYSQSQSEQMRSLPLISPEMGYWSSEDAGSSERLQAARLVQMFTRGLSQGVQRLAWFAVFDGPPDVPTESHGLFRGSNPNDPRPAFWAYKTMTTVLYGFRYEAPLYTEPAGFPSSWDHEAYLFRRAADDARMVVAWANGGAQNPDGVSELVLDASRVTVVNMLGLSATNPHVPRSLVVQDGLGADLDGQANGQIMLRITQEPVYILLP
ncbi:MAG: hypothetical protein HPY83_00170 [Anaerolineae bacterium]|nr:hypothetical protein [Anaerolineae bacterium]